MTLSACNTLLDFSGTGSSNNNSTESGNGDGPGANRSLYCEVHPATFADNKHPINTIYVNGAAAPGGNGSATQPFRDLSAAAPAATPGTKIVVQGTVLNSNSEIQLIGTADNPIWISGTPQAVVRGSISAWTPALKLHNSSYVIVENLEFADGGSHVLHFDFSDHLMFRNLHVHDSREACLKGSQSSFIYVEDSEFNGAATVPSGDPLAWQVLDYVGVNGGHILRSKFHNGKNALIMLKGGTSDLLFAFNELYNQHDTEEAALYIGQWTAPQSFQPLTATYEVLRVVAFANYIHDVAVGVAFRGAHDSAALHNTIADAHGPQLVRYLTGSAGQQSGATQSSPHNSRFAGNIIVGGNAGDASMEGHNNTGLGNLADHNVWFKPPPLNWWSDIGMDMITSTYDQDPALDADGIATNIALVQGKGPTDIDNIAFKQHFIRDFAGNCVTMPMDIGAITIP